MGVGFYFTTNMRYFARIKKEARRRRRSEFGLRRLSDPVICFIIYLIVFTNIQDEKHGSVERACVIRHLYRRVWVRSLPFDTFLHVFSIFTRFCCSFPNNYSTNTKAALAGWQRGQTLVRQMTWTQHPPLALFMFFSIL